MIRSTRLRFQEGDLVKIAINDDVLIKEENTTSWKMYSEINATLPPLTSILLARARMENLLQQFNPNEQIRFRVLSADLTTPYIIYRIC